MKMTTLCYIEKDEKYLMLHRIKKEHDLNEGKYIGIGGHFEHGESPDECLLREVKEETGLKLLSYRPRGIITFIYGEDTVEYMHLYTADKFRGKLIDCNEGELVWVNKKDVFDLNIWEGDQYFLNLIQNDIPYFSLKLVYSPDDKLVSAVLDGQELLKKPKRKSIKKESQEIIAADGSNLEKSCSDRLGSEKTNINNNESNNLEKKSENIVTIKETTDKPNISPKREILKDKDIREPLFNFLEDTYGKVRILEEKTVGKSRADILMVVPDALYGIEIKSDADTYTRLADQVKDYDKYFDYNIVVVGSTHGEHTHEHVPPYWGIITVEIVDGAFDFYILRAPQPNPKMKWKRKLELLWRPELAQIQNWNRMPKYKGLSRVHAADKIIELMPEIISEETLRRQVSEILFERDYSKVKEVLKEYRKSEIDKKLETETDPEKRMELLERKKNLAKTLVPHTTRRYRRRRKS